MDYKKSNAPSNTVTHDMMELCADTGNMYETVAIIGKRSNQIGVEMKQDLEKVNCLILKTIYLDMRLMIPRQVKVLINMQMRQRVFLFMHPFF